MYGLPVSACSNKKRYNFIALLTSQAKYLWVR